LGTSRAQITRAILEGVGFEVLRCLAALDSANFQTEEVVLLGKSYRQDWVCQMMSDLLARHCLRPRDGDPALTGAMLLAGAATAAWADPEVEAARRLTVDRDFEPDPVNRRTYALLAANYGATSHNVRATHEEESDAR
jgi:xylulokinase